MARIEDIPQPTRDAVANLVCQSFDTTPFVAGPPLAERRVAIDSVPPSELLISHVSINFDRSGFQRDINTAYPIQRLQELAAEGVIGSIASTHYTVMGSTDPATMEGSADQISGQLRQERIDAVLLSPV